MSLEEGPESSLFIPMESAEKIQLEDPGYRSYFSLAFIIAKWGHTYAAYLQNDVIPSSRTHPDLTS